MQVVLNNAVNTVSMQHSRCTVVYDNQTAYETLDSNFTGSQRHTYSALLVLTLTSSALYDTEAPYNVSLQSLAGYLAVEDSYGLENATVSAGAASGIAASEDLVLRRLGGSSAEVGLLLTSSSQDFSPVTISIAGLSILASCDLTLALPDTLLVTGQTARYPDLQAMA